MAANFAQQSQPTDLTASDLEALTQALNVYCGLWRPVITFAPHPLFRESSRRWLCVYWTGPMGRGFIPPVSVARDGRRYSIVILDPFVLSNTGLFEALSCHNLTCAKELLYKVLEEFWKILFQVDSLAGSQGDDFAN